MVQAMSLLNQLLQHFLLRHFLLRHFPRSEFAALGRKHGAERGAKGFTCCLGKLMHL